MHRTLAGWGTLLTLLTLLPGSLLAVGLGSPAGSTASAESGSAVGGSRFIPAPLPSVSSPRPSFPGDVRSRLGPASAPSSGTTDTVRLIGSANWSGYVQSATTDVFTSVTDTWTVPAVSTAAPGVQVSSDWVGIGGFRGGDDTLVQAGTESENDNGRARYHAWTEILPGAEEQLSMVVRPGDAIVTVVAETAPGTWLMSVTDRTTQKSASRTVAYVSSGTSAEAVHERPELCSQTCSLADLAATSSVPFDPGAYTTVYQTTAQPLFVPAVQRERSTRRGVRVRDDRTYEVVMVGPSATVIATPSPIDPDTDGFAVADGDQPPPQPPS